MHLNKKHFFNIVNEMRAEGADGSSGKEYDGSTQPIKSH